MGKSLLLPLDLQLFAGEGEGEEAVVEPGVEGVPAAEEPETVTPDPKTGVDEPAAAELEKQNNFEKAFAKRLAAEREKWQTEQSEKYKGFEDYKKATEYLQKTSGISDLLTLREQIELAELTERAEKENVPAEVLKRIDQLEVKAAKADEMEAEAKQQKEWQEFEGSLKEFAKDKAIDDKPLDHMELWKFMHENGVSKPEIAFKAMKAELLEAKLETAKTDAVNEYLKSKQGTKTEGAPGTTATTTVDPPSSWKEAEQRAIERLRAARTPT
jgi:hypothetical protein